MPDRLAGNWLAGFRHFTSESESPNSFLFWSSMVALSGATMRRLWVNWRYTPIYTNLYIKLVGPSGVGKGQAIGFAKRFLTRIDVPVSGESGSREGLIFDMIESKKIQEIDGILWETSPMVVVSPDFMSFYGTSAETMIAFLTEIYDTGDFDDKPWIYKIRNRPTESLPRPFVVMLAGTTESWMSENFNVSFTDQGYAARVLFIHASKVRFRKSRPKITAEMWDMLERLTIDLKHISSLSGEFHVTEEAWEWFNHWYEDIWPQQRLDPRLTGYLERKPLQLWKTVMLCQVAQSDELEITPEMFQFALGQLENIEPGMVNCFQGVGKNPIGGNYVRIWQELIREKHLTNGQLIERFSNDLNKQQLDEIMVNLQLMKRVTMGINRHGDTVYTPIIPGIRPNGQETP